MSRKTTDPVKIKLESGPNSFECETNWDSSFNNILDLFIGLCSAAGFGDKSELCQIIYNKLEEEHFSDEDFERRRKENPILFKM